MDPTLPKLQDLPKDVLVSIALLMDVPEILNLCKTGRDIDRKLCQNDDFWNSKIYHDYKKRYSELKKPKEECQGLDSKKCYYHISLSILKDKLNYEGTIDQLFNEKKLVLSYQIKVVEIPPEIGLLSNLKYLDLSENDIKEIPAQIGQLSNLETLRLNGNKMEKIPQEIGLLSNLQELDLSDNKIEEISPEIGQLSQLRTIYLDQNQLTEVPKEIGQLSNLHFLSLAKNKIEEIPKEIGQLSNLDILGLTTNKIKKLPSEIQYLSNLTDLYLEENEISYEEKTRIRELLPGVRIWMSYY